MFSTSAAPLELNVFSHFIPQLAPLGLRNGLYICRSFGAESPATLGVLLALYVL